MEDDKNDFFEVEKIKENLSNEAEEADYPAHYLDQHYNAYLVGGEEDSDYMYSESHNSVDIPFKWDHIMTVWLLEEYNKLKYEFRDPRSKKLQLWGKIKDIFETHGFIVSEDILSTKFRNMKKTFIKICNSDKVKTGRVKITWEYYNHFYDIFGNEFYNTDNVITSQLCSCTPKVSKSTSTEDYFPTNNTNHNSTLTVTRKRKRLYGCHKAERVQKKTHLLQKKRDNEFRNLITVIKENNEIQKERNVLLKELVNMMKG